MKNIKLVVKENLIKRFNLQESLNAISLEEDNDKRFHMTIGHLGKLIDEGYDNTQLEQHIDEQFDWLKNMFSQNPTNPSDANSMDKLRTTAGKGAIHQFQQWGIRKLLGLTGIPEESPMAYGIATAISDMSLMDIVSIFRDKQGCYSHSDSVARGIIDGLVAAMRAEASPNSWIGNFLQNSMSQYLYDKGLFRKIGSAVCDLFYRNKSKGPMSNIGDNSPKKQIPTSISQTKTPEDADYQFKGDTEGSTSPI